MLTCCGRSSTLGNGVTVAAHVAVNRPRAPALPQHQRVLRHADGEDAQSDAALCLHDQSLRRVRSWRACLADKLLEGLLIDSIVEAEETTDACRHVAPVPGGEDALHTMHTAMSFSKIE